MAVITQDDTGRAGGQKTVTVFGGTGFLGRRIVQHLLARGFLVRAASRHPESVPPLFRTELPNLTALGADIHREDTVTAAISGATAVVNAVSLYVERGGDTFYSVHVDAAGHLAHLCREAEVERYVHISGIGADPSSSSAYIRARGQGEAAVRERFPNAILIRPAVMFGPDDAFLTTLIQLLKKLPIYPRYCRRIHAAGARAAKRVTRVLACAVPASHCTAREAFMAAAVQACCSPVLAMPM
jgi:uncharacterized protein YbjT (DUF2867 family)